MTHQTNQPTAIFNSVGQALHVAFLIMSVEAQQDSPLRKALIRMMSDIDLSAGQTEWLDQLRGTASESVNFSGLSSSDVRAQCALIISSVRTKLPDPEMWAVQAKFGHMDMGDEEGQRRYAFSSERVTAIKGLADWLAPSFKGLNPFALDCIVAKAYADHVRTSISFRDLANSLGGSHMTYKRRYQEVKHHLCTLEQKAMDRLQPMFEQQGIVGVVLKSA